MKLELAGIFKAFGDNPVLKGVDLELNGGEVVALVGENGAGKSTLTRVISGVYTPDEGSLTVDGLPITFSGPQDAMASGIHVIYQEFAQNLFPTLDVASNLFPLDRARRFGRIFVNRGARRKAATGLLESLNINVDPDALVTNLRVGDQQMVAVAKAIGEEVKLLILDEPTASLDQAQSEELFAHVNRLRDSGVAVLYISHRLAEVFSLADRIVVLRDGVVSATGTPQTMTEREVVAAMVGRSVENFYPKERHATDEDLLQVHGLAVEGAFRDIDFTVHRGEVLGIGGVVGCGKEELLRSLFGLAKVSCGEIRLEGRPVALRTPAKALENSLAYVTLDRQGEGLGLQRSIRENLTMSSLAVFTKFGFIDRVVESVSAQSSADRMRVRASSIEQGVGSLSGGNQQKVLIGRSATREPKVLLLHEPTRGVDVAAKTEIYQIMNEQAASGAGVILVSSDLPELVEMSDRVIVMRDGVAVGELTGESLTQQSVLDLALIGGTDEH
jgi:ribose transport system ATP-binding protein